MVGFLSEDEKKEIEPIFTEYLFISLFIFYLFWQEKYTIYNIQSIP